MMNLQIEEEKGEEKENITVCCMCERDISISLVPRKCLEKHGRKAHQICKDCWFSDFAQEHNSHDCPGCKKGQPFTQVKAISLIDLTQ